MPNAIRFQHLVLLLSLLTNSLSYTEQIIPAHDTIQPALEYAYEPHGLNYPWGGAVDKLSPNPYQGVSFPDKCAPGDPNLQPINLALVNHGDPHGILYCTYNIETTDKESSPATTVQAWLDTTDLDCTKTTDGVECSNKTIKVHCPDPSTFHFACEKNPHWRGY